MLEKWQMASGLAGNDLATGRLQELQKTLINTYKREILFSNWTSHLTWKLTFHVVHIILKIDNLSLLWNLVFISQRITISACYPCIFSWLRSMEVCNLEFYWPFYVSHSFIYWYWLWNVTYLLSFIKPLNYLLNFHLINTKV